MSSKSVGIILHDTTIGLNMFYIDCWTTVTSCAWEFIVTPHIRLAKDTGY